MSATLHVTGDIRPGGRFTVRRLPTPVASATATVSGVALNPIDWTTFAVPPGAAAGEPIVVSDGSASRAFEVQSRSATTWVIPLATQSNMLGRDGVDGSSWPAGVSFFTLPGGIVAPSASIASADSDAGPFLIAKSFAQEFLSDHPGDTIIFVPSAKGGTGFSNSRWRPVDDLFNRLVAATTATLRAFPASRLRCLLVQGFESDAGAGTAAATFRSQLNDFIETVRTNLGSPELPVVLGEMPDDYVGASAGRIAIRDEVLLAPTLIPYTSIASSQSPTILDTFDGTHFRAADQIYMGARHYAALASADASALT